MRAAVLLLAVAACGRDAAPTRAVGPSSAVSPTIVEAQPAGADDAVVATVNGHPVYGSCVAAQAAAHALEARAALDQCVAFELLAQEAEARGLRADVEVGEAWRRELVRAVIDDDLGEIDTFDELPRAFLDRIEFDEKQRPFLHRPEMRAAYFVRAAVAKTAKPGGAEDEAARALAQAIYDELRDRDDVLRDDLVETGTRLAAERGMPEIQTEPEPYFTPPDDSSPVRAAVPPFRNALYALPAIGTVHAPVRTKWGWDVILWHDTLPAADLTEQMLGAAMRGYFVVWSDAIARTLGRTWTIDEALLASLAEPETATTAQAGAPESP